MSRLDPLMDPFVELLVDGPNCLPQPYGVSQERL